MSSAEPPSGAIGMQDERDRRNDHERTKQEPNDLNGSDAVDHEPGAEIGNHERNRAPQPYGAIGAATQCETLERVSVEQRHGRRRGKRSQGNGEHDGSESIRLAENHVGRGRSEGARDQRAP